MELPHSRFKALIVDVLRDLVRFDTTNPPGNETPCARYLADLLAPAGIETQVIESAPGRGNLIARLRGTGQAKPLMLMGHLDVVQAHPESWSYPPFGAEIHDGFMWGRGTTDMKQMLAISAVIMLAMATLKQPLRRDLLFVATADEEHGGRLGMGWLAREMPALFDVACALNEGGGSALEAGKRLFYTCQSAEKGVCRTVWRAQAAGGHASQPRDDIATLKLSQALCRLGDGHVGVRVIDTMQRALRLIARALSAETEERVVQLLQNGQIEEALSAAGFEDEALKRHRALFYDTASVTGLRAGDPQSINVIPPVATAYVDGRILPGQTDERFVQALRTLAGDGIEIELYDGQYSPGLESSTDAPIFETIAQVVAERCHGAMVVPWQCAGSTDAKHLIPLGVPVYGFVPAKPLPEGIKGAGAHANDERLWLENLRFALEILFDVVYRFCQ
ncbi:MAG: M20/M25/M40 family metallo-hydrolase [Anaerolineae bacterium]|nr:M20/M25/M40 family metallo-hydrolase [Anaerolineae bacterium]